MLNVPVAIQNVIKNDATLKNFRVHFPNGERADLTNENIVFESVRFTESVCSSNTFRFGLAEASVIEFEMVGIENISGKTIECSIEFKVPQALVSTYGEWYSIPYGTFIVDKCPRDHQNMAHRKVVGYSLLKNSLKESTFMQNMVVPVSTLTVPLNSMIAYLTGDTSMFNEQIVSGTGGTVRGGAQLLFTSDRRNVSIYLTGNSGSDNNMAIRTAIIDSGRSSAWASDKGFVLEYEETGSITNEEFGKEFVRQFEQSFPNLDVRYDPSGKKIFETIEDAFRFAYPVLFHPSFSKSPTSDNLSFRYYYRGQPVELNKFNPMLYDTNLDVDDYSADVSWLVGTPNAGNVKFGVMVDNAGLSTYINVSGFSADAVFKKYSQNGNEFGTVLIDSTLVSNNAFINWGMPSNNYKYYYGTMYNYSNAFSNKDMMNGFAELKSSFIHSERDGTLSIEPLDNSNPYQISLSDVEGKVWWDEYVVSQIGTIKYTFMNPATGQIANGSYVINPDLKSVYDLSGNEVLESMNFRAKKVSAASAMKNKLSFYVYTGSESGYTNGDWYYNNGNAWVSGGHWDSPKSIVEYTLQRLFVPHKDAVNFTPVEMNLRGLPFLEAGDAITLTAEDGTVLNSYILNHTISGIQHLAEDIDSVSGEVIE